MRPVGLVGVIGAGVVALLAGCGIGTSAEEEAHDQLQAALDGLHSRYLEHRSRDPYSTGATALAELDPYGDAVAATTDGAMTTLVRTIEAQGSEAQFAAPSRQVWMGACIEVTIVAGSGGADRGSVTTEPVRCPPGTEAEFRSSSVEGLVIDLGGRSDDVPEPEPDRSVCISGELCTEGGG